MVFGLVLDLLSTTFKFRQLSRCAPVRHVEGNSEIFNALSSVKRVQTTRILAVTQRLPYTTTPGNDLPSCSSDDDEAPAVPPRSGLAMLASR